MFIAPKARVICLGLYALMFLPVLRSKANIGHAIDVIKLVEVSDVVLVGRVISITDQGPSTIDTPSGPMPGKQLLAVLKTDEALKGSAETPSVALEFRLSEAPSGIRGIPVGQYGILFLTKQSSSYRVSDPYYPFLPVVPSTKVSSGTPLDQVIARLGETLTYEGSTEFEVASALDALPQFLENRQLMRWSKH